MNKALALVSVILLATAAGQASSKTYNIYTPDHFNLGVAYNCSVSAQACASLIPDHTGPLDALGTIVALSDIWTFTTANIAAGDILLLAPLPTSVWLFISALVGLVTVGRNRKPAE